MFDQSYTTHEMFTSDNTWITDEEHPDPNPLPRVCGWNLLIRPVPPVKKTKGGIILTDGTQKDMAYLSNVGRVVSLGPLCYDNKAKFGTEPWVKVGDYVVFGRNQGQRLKYKGVKFVLLTDDKPLLVIDKPSYIDQNFNLAEPATE